MNKLHPGARWLFRLQAFNSLIYYAFFITMIFQTTQIVKENSIIVPIVYAVIYSIISALIISEIYARMSYTRWLYEINNKVIKVEHGIIWKKYTSIPFERIQNIDIQRGIIARMAGFSSVNIETAGKSGFGGGQGNKQYHGEGYLPAIDAEGAEKIRILIMKKIKPTSKGGQGL